MIYILPFSLPPSTEELQWASSPIIESNSKSNSRLTLLLYLLHLHYHNRNNSSRRQIPPPEYRQLTANSMRIIYRSLPVSFLHRQEVTHAFRYTSADHKSSHRAYLGKVWDFYEKILADEPDFRVRGPRRLTHLCRCKVRGMLKENCALPQGIDKLDLPEVLTSYLRLEH